jgi:hypothetical protein
VEAAIGALGQQLQQLAPFVAPGGGLPEEGEGGGGGPQAIGIVEVEQAGADGAGERLLYCFAEAFGYGGQGAQFAEQGGPAGGEAGAQAGRHRLLGDAIEHQPAAGWQERKALIELGLQLTAAATEQGAEALVEAEAAVLLTDGGCVSWPSAVRQLLPVSGERRRPRPSCCRNTKALSVGRSSSTVSMVGMSSPWVAERNALGKRRHVRRG